MYFESIWELLAMDGHGVYVWSVYVFAILVGSVLIVDPLLKKRRVAVEVDGQRRREQNVANRTTGLE